MTDSLSSEHDVDPATDHRRARDATDRQGRPVIAAPRAGNVVEPAEPSLDDRPPASLESDANTNGESDHPGSAGASSAATTVDASSPIDADELIDSLLGDDAIEPVAASDHQADDGADDRAGEGDGRQPGHEPVSDAAPPTPPPGYEIEGERPTADGGQAWHPPSNGSARPEHYEPTEHELHQLPPPVVKADDHDQGEDEGEGQTAAELPARPEPDPAPAPAEGLTSRATTPELGQLELRQIAGLTSGTRMPLEAECYDFAQDDGVVGFQVQIDRNDRAVVIPQASTTKIDTVEIHGPEVIGLGVLDVGSARFLVRHRREHKRATDWLDLHDSVDRSEPLIHVPTNLGRSTGSGGDAARKRSRRRRRRKGADAPSRPNLDPVSWEFIERIRSTRIELTDRERYLHPDPAELAERARQRAPILAIRPPGHPLFAKVSVLAADMPWMPRFDDIAAIPDDLGSYLKPLMSLPSQPIAADLMIGPLGIVGAPSATMACARHIITSLFGLSTPELRLHVATVADRIDLWDWSYELAPPGPIEVGRGFPVVVIDGMASFPSSGLAHADAIEHRAGAVFLAESVEELPSYCGTVLQVDGAGSGLLTNHLGHIIAGTPIGITTAFAAELADDLMAVMERRHNR